MKTLVVYNAVVLTQNPIQPVASGLVIQGDRILVTGDPPDLLPYLDHADQVEDAKGRVVVPGFVDCHAHLSLTGLGKQAVDLNDALSKPEILEKISTAAEGKPGGSLLIGMNFQGADITPAELDHASGSRPVYLMDRTGHQSTVNQAALTLLHLNPGDAGVEKDAARQWSGLLTGLANNMAFKNFWPIFGHITGQETAFRIASQEALKGGITSVHSLEDLEIVQEWMNFKDRLPIRIVPYTQTKDVKSVVRLGLKQIGGCGDVMLDGDFDPHTAALLEPYTDRPDTSGLLYYSDAELREYIEEAHLAGLQIGLHCVGSAAIEQLLNIYEDVLTRYPRQGHRHRIEHFELPAPGQAERAKKLGICLSIQPSFNHLWPHTNAYPELIGLERSKWVDPVARLTRLDIRLGLGSDSPVTPLQGMLWIHSAVNHSNPEQRISVEKALQIAMVGSSYLAFEEALKGSLEPGKLADFVILDRNPLTTAPEELKDIQVLKTYVGGKLVYSAESGEAI
jgi:predicted amidohydrolase YtcJ